MTLFNYNIHPIFVHFPIALLTIYSVFELISFGEWSRSREWIYIKTVFLTIGGLSALVAKFLGDTAKRLLTDTSLMPIVNKHELFADLTIAIFGILAAAYVVRLIAIYLDSKLYTIQGSGLLKFIFAIQRFVTETPIVKIGALAGLGVLTIAGALGGSITYGSSNDPITNYIFHLFF